MPRSIKAELKSTLKLAVPVVFSELAWMAMNLVDVLMVGRVDVASIGAVSLGSTVHFVVLIVAFGVLLGLDPLVAQAFGAGRPHDCQRALTQGVYFALFATPLVMGAVWLVKATMPSWGVEPAVLERAGPYVDALNWGTGPLLMYTALRRYLQAVGLVRSILAIMLISNVINAVACWAFIFGNWGAPAWGAFGAGVATSLARAAMMAMLLGVMVVYHRGQVRAPFPWRFEPALTRKLLALGAPSAGHLLLEMGVFGTATVLASRLDAASLAAHQVVLNMASITFMVPLGLSSAAAVRVGHLIGAGDPRGARRAGWLAMGLSVAFMATAGAAFVLFPRTLIAAYTPDFEVMTLGVPLMALAAMFQVFDGAQVTATGAMRGAGATKFPVLCNFVAHWTVGLPIAIWLGLFRGLGVHGIWIGLTVGIALVGGGLTWGWANTSRRLSKGPKDQVPSHVKDGDVREDVADVPWPDRPVPQPQA